jgi:acetyl-CoA carboxylase biotin carboxyl carrier protein
MTRILAEMSARVWQLPVADRTQVEAGEVVAVLESMKMEIPVTAPVSGLLVLLVQEGAEVTEGDPIAEVR